MPDGPPSTASLPGAATAPFGRLRRAFKGVALLGIAAGLLAVALALGGDEGPHLRLLVMAALGAGLAVLFAALPGLALLGWRAPGRHWKKDQKT